MLHIYRSPLLRYHDLTTGGFMSPFTHPCPGIRILPVVALLGWSYQSGEAQTPGLVAAYAFNEGTGTTVVDASGNGLTGTISGATWTPGGKYGNALSFNGTSSYVDLGNPALLQITGSMTWSAWVFAAANPTDDGQIIAKSSASSGWQLKSSPDTGPETFGIAVSGDGTSETQRYSSTVRALNTWYYVAGVYNASARTLDIYVNGVLDNGTLSGTIPSSQFNSGDNVNVGRRTGGFYFDGIIDEVRIYNRALTEAEIQTDMTTPIGNPPPPGISINPEVTALTFTRTQQFVSNDSSVVWLVDGIVGGSSSSGTITAAGLYSPPAAIGSHTVTVRTSDLLQSASAMVYIVNHPGVFTHHNDNLRTGQNVNETVLTPATVAAGFGKLFSYAIDGLALASPLYLANVNIPGRGFHNVVYVATEHNSVYAFDADGLDTLPLWHVSFLGPGVTTVPCADVGECGDIPDEIGITGTPVIDPVTATLYVVAKTKEGTNYVQRLHAMDIMTGSEKFGGPVEIQATVPGTGVGSQNGQLPFLPLRENQRPALLLNNGVVYIAFGSHGDVQPYHGWVIGYNASTLQRVFAFCVTPDNEGAGVWQSGGGLAADAAGNTYFASGDGTFTGDVGGIDYGDSYLKLNATGSVLDYFTPHDQLALDQGNLDLCAGGVILLPDQPGSHPHLLIGSGKNATVYVVNRDSMGHFNPVDDSHAVQTLPNIFPNGTPEPGNYINPVYFNGTVYFSPVADNIQSFPLNNGLLTTVPASRSVESYPYPGGALAISANGTANGILWTVQRNDVTSPGVLFAYDPANLGNIYYSSSQAGARDLLDAAAKFNVPLVANGKVYVVAVSHLTAFGGITAVTTNAPEPPLLVAPANGVTDAPTNPLLAWNASPGASSYHVQISTDPGFATTVIDRSDLAVTSLSVSGLSGNTQYFWHVSATSSGGTSSYLTARTFTTLSPLPIQLASFVAVRIGDHVQLDWSTISEIHNYGFFVQKKRLNDSLFSDVPNGFIPGHGTTNEPQHYRSVDSTVSPGVWYYRLKQMDLDGSVHYSDMIRIDFYSGVSEQQIPTEFSLSQNYPDPFNPSTRIRYALPHATRVRLIVYNTLGQQVAQLVNGQQEAGYHETGLHADGLPSGVYFYRLDADSFTSVRKMLLLK